MAQGRDLKVWRKAFGWYAGTAARQSKHGMTAIRITWIGVAGRSTPIIPIRSSNAASGTIHRIFVWTAARSLRPIQKRRMSIVSGANRSTSWGRLIWPDIDVRRAGWAFSLRIPPSFACPDIYCRDTIAARQFRCLTEMRARMLKRIRPSHRSNCKTLAIASARCRINQRHALPRK
jgi:hypothetical protein